MSLPKVGMAVRRGAALDGHSIGIRSLMSNGCLPVVALLGIRAKDLAGTGLAALGHQVHF